MYFPPLRFLQSVVDKFLAEWRAYVLCLQSRVRFVHQRKISISVDSWCRRALFSIFLYACSSSMRPHIIQTSGFVDCSHQYNGGSVGRRCSGVSRYMRFCDSADHNHCLDSNLLAGSTFPMHTIQPILCCHLSPAHMVASERPWQSWR